MALSRRGEDGLPVFVEVDAPTDEELHARLQALITRGLELLTCHGILVEAAGHVCLAEPYADGDEARTLRPLQIAVGFLSHGLRLARRAQATDGAGY